ncbi:MAG TPA: DNA-3-methyladenine glycosylase [Longimicrobiaceae bacterium]|nr:DNA-3-methyladenine glycosylase [Longimicrobiaceae bacterium]
MTTRRRDAVLPAPEAVAHLRAADPVLRDVIDRVGTFEISMERDLWWALVDAISSQQLSVRAAATIVGRLHALGVEGRPPTPEEVLALPDETLRGAGLSRAKTAYVRDVAARWLDGSLRQHEVPGLPDEEVIATLTQVKGIGRWTAEMILVFCLDRPDVLPVDDLGIRVAARRWYALPERPGKDELERIAEPWRPFRTLASRYLWKSLNATRGAATES